MKNRKIYTILALFMFFAFAMQGQEKINIYKATLKSEKKKSLIKTFPVSKGDIIEIKIHSLHKKKGVSIILMQHPGRLDVLEFENVTNSTKYVVAPADAIYELLCGENKINYEIEVNNITNNPQGPGKGAITYVCIPDTTFASGYVNTVIGEDFKLVPYKEKVILNSYIQTEPIATRDFITGVDIMNLKIPGDRHDEYRDQKLLDYNISLTVDAPSCYSAMMGVVDAGMDSFVPDFSPTSKIMNRTKKMNQRNMYEVVGDMNKESEKWEKTVETISLAQELGESYAPHKDTDFDKFVNTTGFLLDTDGMKKMALNKGMNAAGVPSNVQSLVNTVEEIPSATDFLKDGVRKYASRIKGRAEIQVFDMDAQHANSGSADGRAAANKEKSEENSSDGRLILDRVGGAINEKIHVTNRRRSSSYHRTMKPYKDVKIKILKKDGYSADAKLIVEAKYLVTDYTDVVKYRKVAQPVSTKEFLTSYKINYHYDIMFKDQMKNYYQAITKKYYYSKYRSGSETRNDNDPDQNLRLANFERLVKHSAKK